MTRFRKFANAAISLFMIACSEPTELGMDASHSSDAGPQSVDAGWDGGRDAGGDAGPSYPIDHECAEPCVIRWRELSPLDQAIDHHTTFILEREDGPYLYVLGGFRSDSLGSALVGVNPRLMAAPILEDGTLGEWETEPFGYGIGFHAQAQSVHDDGTKAVYWVGGYMTNAEAPFSPGASWYTLVGEFPPGPGPGIDGVSFGGDGLTRLAGELGRNVMHGTATIHLGQLFLIGGGSDTFTEEVLRYDLETDQWVEDAPLSATRSHHALVTIGESLVLLGGMSGSHATAQPAESIVRSVHDEAGHITAWEEIGRLPDAPWTASAFVRDGFIYVVGGGFGASIIDRVRRAPIASDGTIGSFEDIGPLPLARAHVHQTPIYGDYIYSVGGRIEQDGGLTATARVFVGELE